MSSIGHNSLLHQRIWHFNRWEMMCDHSNLLYIISHQSVCWSLDIISSYRHCQSFLVKYLWMPPFGAPSAIHPNCKYSPKTFSNQTVTKGTQKDLEKCLGRSQKLQGHMELKKKALAWKCTLRKNSQILWRSLSSGTMNLARKRLKKHKIQHWTGF